MAAPSLVSDVQALSRQLAQAMDKLPPCELYDEVAGAKPYNDFLFELKVLFSLLSYLAANNWTIQVENLQGQHVRLPRSSGRKRNFTYFRISHKTDGDWHLVHGTDIATHVGKTVAPDISLQELEAGINPRYGQVKAIWDAKLRGPDGAAQSNRVTDQEFRSFLWVRDVLKVCRPGQGDPLQNWPPAFEVTGLISNGDRPSGWDAMFLEGGVSVVNHFSDASSPTHPSRKEHLSVLAPAP